MMWLVGDSEDRFDRIGCIKYMTRCEGYVMARRPRCDPFILSEKDWRKLPKSVDAGRTFEASGGIVVRFVEP